MSDKPVIGFIGLGIMGCLMARNLQAAGYELVPVDFDPPLPGDLLDGGAQVKPANGEFARASDTVVVMVPDTPDVETVLLAEEGVANGLRPGQTVVDMSSISPAATIDFARRINSLG